MNRQTSARRTILFVPCLLTLAALAPTIALGQPSASEPALAETAIHCPAMIDVLDGRRLGPTTILIRGDRIAAVSQDGITPNGAKAIEIPAGQTCLPGLFDVHTHVSIGPKSPKIGFAFNNADWAVLSTLWARQYLMSGFTTIRNVGDRDYETVALRNQINAGELVGPRIFTAGVPLSTTGGHADGTDGLPRELAPEDRQPVTIIDNPDAARKAVRYNYKQNVDLIKIMASGGNGDLGSNGDGPQMTLEEMQAVVSTAHDYGFTVAAHAHGAEAIRRAVIAGVDSIEHGTYMDEEDRKLMKAHGTFFVPTMSQAQYRIDTAKIPGRYPPQVVAKIVAKGRIKWAAVKKAFDAGINMAVGTDFTSTQHDESWREFPLLVDAGVSSAYALKMGTINAARLLKREDELGSITVGKYADIIAVEGDPLADVRTLAKVTFVMKAGQIFKKDGVAQELQRTR